MARDLSESEGDASRDVCGLCRDRGREVKNSASLKEGKPYTHIVSFNSAAPYIEKRI